MPSTTGMHIRCSFQRTEWRFVSARRVKLNAKLDVKLRKGFLGQVILSEYFTQSILPLILLVPFEYLFCYSKGRRFPGIGKHVPMKKQHLLKIKIIPLRNRGEGKAHHDSEVPTVCARWVSKTRVLAREREKEGGMEWKMRGRKGNLMGQDNKIQIRLSPLESRVSNL